MACFELVKEFIKESSKNLESNDEDEYATYFEQPQVDLEDLEHAQGTFDDSFFNLFRSQKFKERMSRITLRFVSNDVETTFLFFQGASVKQTNAIMILLVSVGFVFYGMFTLFSISWETITLAIVLLILSIMNLGGVAFIRLAKPTYYQRIFIYAAMYFITGAVLTFDQCIRLIVTPQITIGIPKIMYYLFGMLALQISFRVAVVLCLVDFVIFVIAVVLTLALSHSADKPHPSLYMSDLLGIGLVLLMIMIVSKRREFATRKQFLSQQRLNLEYQRSDRLLSNMLPESILWRLKEGQTLIADTYSSISILFCEIMYFSQINQKISAKEVVSLLNGIYCTFDRLVEQHGIQDGEHWTDLHGGCRSTEKMVKSTKYLFANESSNNHAEILADLALDMLDACKNFKVAEDFPITIRIGIHSGPVQAGVVGGKNFSYKLFGDTVNTASRMQSNSQAGRINISPITFDLLKDSSLYDLEPRGKIAVKGKGEMELYFLNAGKKPKIQRVISSQQIKNARTAAEVEKEMQHFKIKLPQTNILLRYHDKELEQSFSMEAVNSSVRIIRMSGAIQIVLTLYALLITFLDPGVETDRTYGIIALIIRGGAILQSVLLVVSTYTKRKFLSRNFQIIITLMFLYLLGEQLYVTSTFRGYWESGLFTKFTTILITFTHFIAGYDFVLASITSVSFSVAAYITQYFESGTHALFLFLVANVLVEAVDISSNYIGNRIERTKHYLQYTAQQESKKSDDLLYSILPRHIAHKLKNGRKITVEEFPNVTLLFTDLVGFTSTASKMETSELVQLLNKMYSSFDALTDQYNVYKVEIVGDAYVAVGGILDDTGSDYNHADAVLEMAVKMVNIVKELRTANGEQIHMRVGIHSGKIAGGVVGIKKFRYHVWGTDVIIANAMESNGTADRIVISEATKKLLSKKFKLEEYKEVSVKDIGSIGTFIVEDDTNDNQIVDK